MENMNLKDFQLHVGELIMYAQIIEDDIKYIYAKISGGNFKEKLEEVKKTTLGQTVKLLEEIDLKRQKPLLVYEYYSLLLQVTAKRNHFVHESFNTFMHLDSFKDNILYLNECHILNNDLILFDNLAQALEEIRISL